MDPLCITANGVRDGLGEWWSGLCRVLLVMDSGRVVCIKWGEVLWNGGVSSKCVFIIGLG